MQGISPMIATVLLIAFTVAIGGILSVWMNGFITDSNKISPEELCNQTCIANHYTYYQINKLYANSCSCQKEVISGFEMIEIIPQVK